MKATNKNEKTTADKIALFRSYFSGMTNVYGTHDPATGRSWQVKTPVTYDTILAHLKGKSPYGIYLLVGDRTRAIAVDFDDSDASPPIEFVNAAKHYLLPAYIETSKSKGFHVWIFFNEKGVKACKARLVVKNILDEMGYPHAEIFPKQDSLDTRALFGNFINAPLFGGLVPLGKTVFVDPNKLDPYPDQWAFLESIERVDEHILDEIIEVNDLSVPQTEPQPSPSDSANGGLTRFSLPLCAQRMFQDGVSQYQRVSCFRLAVHLKKLGLPYDVAVAALKTWALKNRRINGKGVIRESEILSQTSSAYENSYMGYGCESPAVAPFCEPSCPVKQWREGNEKISSEEAVRIEGETIHEAKASQSRAGGRLS